MERGKTKDVEEAGTLVDKSLGTLKMRFVHLSDQLQRDLPHVAEGLNGIPHVFVWLWRINGRIVDLDSHPPPDQKAIPVLRVTRDGFQPRAIIASGGMVCFEAKTHATIVEINNYAFYSPRLQLKQDVKTEFQWLAPEPHPVEIRNIRFPQLLSGWVLVPPHHHVDLSDSRGRIKISGLPPGRLQFRVYDTGGLFIYNVVSGSDLAELSHFNTHLTVTLQAGEVVDLGEIQLTSEQPSR